MKTWKNSVLAVAFMLVAALALAACGSNDTLEGTYVVEGQEASGLTITFTGSNFRYVMPYSEVDTGLDLPGYVALYGTFTVDNRSSLILLAVDEDALRVSIAGMVDVMIEYMLAEPEFAELMANPEFAALLQEYIDATIDELNEELFQEMLDELAESSLRFNRNFDRLYDDLDGTVFVRQ